MINLACSFAVKNISDYQLLKNQGANSFIIGGKNFSRLGEFSDLDLKEIIQDVLKSKLKVEIDVDMFPTHNQFQALIDQWQSLEILPNENLSIRVLDLGLLDWFYQKKYQLIPLLEAGFHNLSAISNIHEYYGDKIHHYVLSKELVFKKQIEYANTYFKKPVEFNLLAPILLFHSPRKLINQYFEHNESYHQSFAASQESVHKGFIVRENRSGTLFYHPKHQCLIGKLSEMMAESNIKYVVDIRLIEDQNLRHQIFSELLTKSENLLDKITSIFPFQLTRGFFDVNKTDVLFPKLKNHHSEHASYERAAEVMDMIKGDGLIIRVLDGANLKLGDKLYFQSPQGNNGVLTLSKLFDLQGREMQTAEANELVKINFMKHFPVDSTIFKIHDNIIP